MSCFIEVGLMLSTKKVFFISAVVVLTAAGSYYFATSVNVNAVSNGREKASLMAAHSADVVVVANTLANKISIVRAKPHDFSSQSEAFGYIDFNQDQSVQVFPSYQGRVVQVLAKAGDSVKKGQALFTIDSPDLVQAESLLISTAGLHNIATIALSRARKMIEIQANAQKDLDQAISDQQTAEGNYQAAYDMVRIFGKSDIEINKIIATRKVNGELTVKSPFAGRVTSRNISAGLMAAPTGSLAPFTVADMSTVWMVANVSEDDLPELRNGQLVSVAVTAYPGRLFQGKITNIAAAVDTATHHIAVRSEVVDSNNALRPQMLANFIIKTGKPLHSVAIPINGVVREGDGTMDIFVTTDGHHFKRRQVKLGLEQDGYAQIIEGLSPEEDVVADGALFLSNALALQAR